jgi:glutathione S-transferase
MRTLYHFFYSPFSRRARLSLAYKGIEHTLKEGRQVPAYMEEAKSLWPLGTIPVLVDEGKAVGDSTAISRYLDAAYPSGDALWPTERDGARASLEVAMLVDGALNHIIDVGTRYYALHGHAEWPAVRDAQVGRAQRALDALAARVGDGEPKPLTAQGWCAPDIWLYTCVAWLESCPSRVASSQNIAQIMTLPWKVPAPLSRWAAAFRDRADVRALEDGASAPSAARSTLEEAP